MPFLELARVDVTGRRGGDPAAASAGERFPSSSRSKAGAIVFTDANVLLCCIIN